MTWIELLSGISLATFGASGLFFLKFWLTSREKFFLYFSFAFWLLSIERIALMIVHESEHAVRNAITEANSWVYLIRLLAFIFIVFAVLERNRKKLL
jgi:hypothetical protein